MGPSICAIGHMRRVCVCQCMAAPVKGALKAVMRIAHYFVDNKEFRLFQPWGTEDVDWRMYSDSNQSSCTDPSNKRRSRLGFMLTKQWTPVMWGSKTTKTSMVLTLTASASLIKDSTSRHVIQTCRSYMRTYLWQQPRSSPHLWLSTSYCTWAMVRLSSASTAVSTADNARGRQRSSHHVLKGSSPTLKASSYRL